MIRHLLFLSISFLMTMGSYAQIIVGDGITGQSEVPFNGYYDYGWSAMIYPQTDIDNAGNITEIAFYVSNNPSNFDTYNQKIYMGHESNTVFSNTSKPDPSSLTEVFNGDITWDGSGWHTITLDTEFNYNNTDNLLVYYENKDGSWEGTLNFYYTISTDDNAIYNRNDGSFPTGDGSYHCFPNIKLTIEEASAPADPSGFSASASSSSQIDLSWSLNGNSNDVIIAYNSNNSFGTPTDGTTYNVNDELSGGGTIIYTGSNTSDNHTALSSNTQYYYKIWSKDGSNNYSGGVTDNATTYSTETDILTYSFNEETGSATIDDVNHIVDIEVNFIADITDLVADFTLSTGATAEVGTTSQESGVTTNDFTDPVTYTIIAEDETATQDWTVTVTHEDTPLGANCDNPFSVSLPNDLPYEDLSETNCGLGNLYEATNMSDYDNGEDAIYEITVTEDVVVDITLDPKSTSSTSIGLFESCPNNNQLVADVSNSTSEARVLDDVELTAGTYYIMVDINPSPNCISDYDLSIEESPCSSNPALTTLNISSITLNSAESGGEVTHLGTGNCSVYHKGVCWNKTGNPTIEDNKTDNGTGAGSYTSSLTGLDANTIYYVRAYATNDNGTAYGTEHSFMTKTVSIPETPTSNSPQCGTVTITRSGTPLSGEVWYWQDAVDGTSMTHSGETYNVSTSGIYYIRPYSVSENVWGDPASVLVEVRKNPTNVSAGDDCVICNGTCLQLNGSADDIDNYLILEDFENGCFPINWTVDNDDGIYEWGVDKTYPSIVQGSNHAFREYIRSHPSISEVSQDAWIKTPSLEFPKGSGFIEFTSFFMGANDDLFQYTEHNYVKISTDGGNTWTIIADMSQNYPDFEYNYGENWGRFYFSLDSYLNEASDNVIIAFHRETDSNGGNADWSINNLSIVSTERPLFSWSSNPAGFSSNEEQPNVSPTETTIYTLETSHEACTTNAEVTTTVKEDGTWRGKTNKDWHNETNWCGNVPTATDDVIIFSGAENAPEISTGDANVNSLIIENGMSLSIINNNTLNINGDFINNGTFYGGSNNETVIFKGENSYLTTGGDNFNNLQINETNARLNLQDNLTLNNDMTISNGCLNASSYSINISGDWVNQDRFIAGTSHISFDGNNIQNIESGNDYFYDVTFNNTNSGNTDIILNDDLYIENKAFFTNGILNANNNSVVFSSTASSTQGNANSFVIGKISKNGATSFTFPTGDIRERNLGNGIQTYNVWAPFTATPAASTTVSVEYRFTNENLPTWWYHDWTHEPPLTHTSDREYWVVNSGEALDVTLFWRNNNPCKIHDFCNGDSQIDYLTIAYWENKWKDAGGNASSESTINGSISSINSIPFNAKSETKITFGGKDTEIPLPIELQSFKAFCNGTSGIINWTTATEINNDYFILEKSNDAKTWFELAKIAGNGFSNSVKHYTYTDNLLSATNNYYRLTQVDYNGTKETLKSIHLNCNNTIDIKEKVIPFPNPCNNQLNISLKHINSQHIVFELYNELGTLLIRKTCDFKNDSGIYKIELDRFKPAIYYLHTITEDDVYFNEIIKQ